MDKNFLFSIFWWEESGTPFGDFCWGQPRDPPKPELLSALHGSLQNGSKSNTPSDYFGYSMFQGDKQRVVAGMIKKHRQLQVEPDDCIITNGALGALMVSLQVLTDQGDEVIMITPWYFFYPAMCEVLGIKLVGVPSLPGNHAFLGIQRHANLDLNLDVIYKVSVIDKMKQV